MKTQKILKKRSISRIFSLFLVLALFCGTFEVFAGKNTIDAADSFEKSISGFPESYKPALRSLHQQYPKWKFVPYNTGLGFRKAVNQEFKNNKSLIENSYSKYLKSNTKANYNAKTGKYIPKDGSSWVVASKNCIAYFLDPRNFLNSTHIYMFEQLSYDSSSQTQSGVESILQGSFMYKTEIGYITTAGKYKSTDTLYSQQIMEAAKKSSVSAYYLASKILQEVGTGKSSKYAGMGSSGSISGTYSSAYTGIYNFYNIGASSGSDPVSNGLSWASSGTTYNRPWNTPAKSINGGAQYIGETYINCGQNTIYYQRFNVNGSASNPVYTHQYMTNISGAASEASYTSEAYESLGIASLEKTFVIPVYKNMPDTDTSIKLGNTSNKTGTVTSSVNLRAGAATSYKSKVTLSKGDTVTIKSGVMTDINYSAKWLSNPYWYKVSATKNGKTYTGYVSASYISMNTECTVIKGGKSQLKTTLGNKEKVYYMSDDPSIVKVNSKGVITGKKEGSATVLAFTAGGNFDAVGVSVFSKGCTLDESSLTLKVGKRKKLTPTVYPTNAADKTVNFASSNKKVAKVSKKGRVRAVSIGEATITASAVLGGVSAKCSVYVVPNRPVATAKRKNNKSIKLSWSAVEGASRYVVYKKTGDKYKKIATVSGKTSYRDKGLIKGTAYSYKVKAVAVKDGSKYKSKRSKAVECALY